MVAALTAPIIAATVAGALSFADATTTKSNLQDTLDAAVLAGASSSDVPELQLAAARTYFLLNAPTGLTEGSSSPAATFSTTGEILRGRASLNLKSLLPGLLGLDTIPIGVTAAARKPRVAICILGLNTLDNGAFDINGNPAFKAPDCAVQANSGSSRAMTQEGNAPAEARIFAVSGGEKTNNFSSKPKTGADRVADPYLAVPFPSHRTCGSGDSKKGLVIQEDTVLSPGVYCGGINITGQGTTVTMSPGVYVMVDGPLLVNGNATLKGDRVMVAFTGDDSTLRVWGDSTVELTSPSAGVYANMQFFQDRNDPKGRGAWVSVGGSGGANDETDLSRLKIDGVAYFPTQNFWIYGKADVDINSPSLAIVADKIWFQGAATIDITTNNARNLTNILGAQISPLNAWLIE